MSRPAFLILLAALLWPAAASAQAPPVPVLPALPEVALPFGGDDVRQAAAAVAQERADAAWRGDELRRLRGSRTIRGALKRALVAERLTWAEHEAHRRTLREAEAAARRLGGEQREALRAIEGLAARRALGTGRLTAAMLTLRRNTAWWSGRRGAPGRDVSWGADPATLRHMPGRGLVLHPLASWGRVNALAGGCLRRPARCDRRRLRGALDRMVALAGRRDGYLAWEHLFAFGGGRPGWVSAMVQGTAVQALARGAEVLDDRRYVRVARSALGAFERRPPSGVAVRGHYLMYSFDPSLRIVNGFLQSLLGLRDLGELAGSRRALGLYRRGERVARGMVRASDTGAWSRYTVGGRENTAGYHRLTGGFLVELCRRTGRGAYCAARTRFARYEREPPRIGLRVARSPRARSAVPVRFFLSKVSDVVVAVRGPRGIELQQRRRLGRGSHTVVWRPARRGPARVRVVAQGPTGPRGVARAEVAVRRSLAEVRAARVKREAAERRARAERRAAAARRRAAAARRRAAQRREAAAERRASARRRAAAERRADARAKAEAAARETAAPPAATTPAG